MLKKKILFYLFFLVFVCKVWAQQDPMYTMYLFDKMLINPAFAGSSSWVVGTVKHREQFVGFEGNPSTSTFNFHAPLQKKHLGVGLKIINDKIAITNNFVSTLFLSYHLNLGGGKLSAGIETGIYSQTISWDALTLADLNDNAINSAGQDKSILYDLGAGIYYQKSNFYGGFSSAHMLKNIALNKSPFPTTRLTPQMNIIAGNDFELSEHWSLEPSTLFKIVKGAPAQMDINLLLSFNNLVTAGIQYRTGDAMAFILRANILDKFRIAYSYDVTISKLSPYSQGAHEVIISYGIKLPPPPAEKEIHPRYYF